MKEVMKSYNVCFLGQTGFGKSSLINALFDAHFNTDPLVACTKELYSVTTLVKASGREKLLTVFDTPGIGEFSDNSPYQQYYNYAASFADHIVLVVTLDRVDSTSQDLLESIKPFLNRTGVRFTIALNRIDSTGVTDSNHIYVPWDEQKNKPSEQCMIRIEERLHTIKVNFGEDIDFLPFEVIPVCAMRHYGIDKLKEQIIKLL